MEEHNFLRYRLEVVRMLAESPYKAALLTAITARIEALHAAARAGRS